MVKNPNISGIIQSIMRFVDAWRASADGNVVIFCITHIEPPTRTGITNGVGSGSPKSNHKNDGSIGIALWTTGNHTYRCWDRSTSFSGVDPTVLMIVWNSPIQIGNCITIGPRQPKGLTPCSR